VKTNSAVLLLAITANVVTVMMKNMTCRIPPIISTAFRSLRPYTLHRTGMVKKAHIKRVLCHLAGTYVGEFKIIRPWMQRAEMNGTAAQRPIQENTL
jgi:hypothetical protein